MKVAGSHSRGRVVEQRVAAHQQWARGYMGKEREGTAPAGIPAGIHAGGTRLLHQEGSSEDFAGN